MPGLVKRQQSSSICGNLRFSCIVRENNDNLCTGRYEQEARYGDDTGHIYDRARIFCHCNHSRMGTLLFRETRRDIG
ncbi:hypothetical protein D3C84_1245420 [compost metagenome]